MKVPRLCCYALLTLLVATITAPSQGQNLNFNLLHTFSGSPDGTLPNTLIRDPGGNLYGTTVSGGFADCPNAPPPTGCGTVFKLANNGDYTVLYAFQGNQDGDNPVGGVSRDAAGNLFGTTAGIEGATATVFKVDKNGNETVLFGFTNFVDGAFPKTPPILDKAGNLYGTTYYGGDVNCGFDGNGCGVVYEITAAGQFKVLHTFTSIKDGIWPIGGLVIEAAGNLYGATAEGGDPNCNPAGPACGTIFEVAKNGKYTVLYRFTGQADGEYPGCVTADGAGGLYGVTGGGGDLGCGFSGCGTIFQISRSAGFKILYAFQPIFPNDQGSDCPVHDSNGNIYGTHGGSGAHGGGYLYKLDASGKYTDIFDFPPYPSNLGSAPTGVVLTPNGDFYGTLDLGGADGFGTVFELTPSAR